ncbi:hypothetical protein OOT00_06060 [Desulfobotulus sp. H1]|uniref:Ferric oxidoreductase domain-containing protein n=1 Tax=Desulfobotulus pelophilus TaxID=2823377 RepID=A0ABT3N7W5_9BACT|nr:hypothetical protein [Desulfobotulus pelophilus]MCW7753552.1 hypothetical protein [Desulfobotulus pelophilus]
MWQSLFMKEWLKLRWYFTAALLVNLGVCMKIFLDIRQIIHMEHAEMVWYQAIHLHTLFYEPLRYLPLITGLVLATAQFLPEVSGRRMRISLHLPMNQNRMLFLSLLAGILHLAAITGLDILLTGILLFNYFPAEVARASVPTLLPWICAGFLAYLGGVHLLLEPSPSRRIFHAFVFASLTAVHFTGSGYNWLSPVLPFLFMLSVLALPGIFDACRRFRQGGA